MDAPKESIQELSMKLITYQQQLAQINAMLLANPGNEDILKMRNDLMEVIELTKTLVREAAVALTAPAASHAVPLAATPAAAAGAGGPIAAAGAGGAAGGAAGLTAPSSAPIALRKLPVGEVADLAALGGEGVLEAGSRVEVHYAVGDTPASWYPGVIEALGEGSTVHVKFIGYGNVEEVDTSTIRPLIPVGNALGRLEIQPGMKVQAKYAPDGKIYSARVESKEPDGEWKVRFMEYSQVEVVPAEYIRGMPKKSDKDKVKEVPDTFVVPEHLKITDDDTEMERKRKKKAIKALKNRHRFAVLDKVTEGKKSNWQSFQNKVQKKSKKKIGGKKESIFKTPDNPSARVGVTGSGKGMTEYESRKKHRRE